MQPADRFPAYDEGMEIDVGYDAQTALIVVDVQNDFADPAGSLYVKGGEHVVPLINAEIARVRAAGGFVVYTRDWHPASTPHFAKDGGVWPVHCVMDTWGSQFHPDLLVDGPEVKKGSREKTATPVSRCGIPKPAKSSQPSWRRCFVIERSPAWS